MTFESDGYAYGNWPGQNFKLAPYVVTKWYTVAIDADLTAETTDIWIDGVLRAQNLSFSAPGTPTGLELGAGHGSAPVAWFDNILVSSSFRSAEF